MNLNILAQDIVVSNPEISLCPSIGSVLRGVAENDPRMNFVLLANFGPTQNCGVGHNPALSTNPNRPIHYYKGTNFGFRMDLPMEIVTRTPGLRLVHLQRVNLFRLWHMLEMRKD